MDKLISIVLPCYKAEAYIGDMLNDVIHQSYKNWELLVVSNGEGQEQQLKIVREYSQKDDRIKLFSTEMGGVSLARNIGLEHAEGDWITFLDADDRIDSNHLQLYVDALEKEDWQCDMIIGGYYIVNGLRIFKQVMPQIKNVRDALSIGNKLTLGSPVNKLYSKRIISNNLFPVNFTVMEDYHFNLSVFSAVSKIVSIPMTGYRYIWWDKGNATSKYHACREEVQRECDRLLTNLYVKAGMFPEEARTILLREKYIETYFGVINLYKEGCLMDLWQKKKKIRQLVFEDADMPEAYQFYPWHRQHLYVRFMTLGYLLRSPFFIALTYQCLFWIKRRIR